MTKQKILNIALGQFCVVKNWQENLHTAISLMQQADRNGADLLVLPESIIARDNSDPRWSYEQAQSLDGEFVTNLLSASKSLAITTICSVLVPAPQTTGVYNTLIAIKHGKIIAKYNKLHLYDAFNHQESKFVIPGNTIPQLIEIYSVKIGLMICYDLRFPELARRLALDGADVIVIPAAWVKGSLKESHWELLNRARALENTTYIVAVGECGSSNIGNSMVVDPLGVVIASAAETPLLFYAKLDPERIRHARSILPVLANRRFGFPELL